MFCSHISLNSYHCFSPRSGISESVNQQKDLFKKLEI